MDISLIATIVTSLVGVATAYHIAVRTGAYLQPSLKLRFGYPVSNKIYRTPIAFLIGVPRTVTRDYCVIPFPVELDSGSAPVKNVHVQFSYPPGRDLSRLNALKSVYKDCAYDGCNRRTIPFGKHTMVYYELPDVRRNQPNTILEMLVFHRDEIQASTTDPSVVNFDEISILVRAENHKGIDQFILVCAVWSDTLEDLQNAAQAVAIAARKKRGLFVIHAKSPGFFFLPQPHRIWLKSLLLCQVNITHADKNVAISSGLDGSATFQTMDFLPVHITRAATR